MQSKREEIPVRDQAGQAETIIRVTPMLPVHDLSGTMWREGLASLFTSDGRRVNALPDGSFLEVGCQNRYWPV